MPPKKKAESKPKAAPKPKAAAKSKAAPKAKAEAKPKTPRKTKKSSGQAETAPSAKVVKVFVPPKISKPKAPAIPKSPLKKMPKRGETQMLAFIRDPQCLFTYWEVTEESISEVKQQLREEFQHSSMVLRVFRKDALGHIELIREIFVESHEMNRYIEINDPQGSYFLEIAHKSPSGQVFVYARSNDVMTGPNGFTGSGWNPGSSAGDPQWETPAGLMDYFSQEEYTETFLTPGGPSSMDSLTRKKGRYAASRI